VEADKVFEVKLLNHFGTDEEICASARISYNNHGLKKTDAQNQGLLNYLAIHSHLSPFEMAEYQFYIKIPLFVFGQLVRHRTANINCKSYRYTEVEEEFEFYVPKILRKTDEKKQGSSDEPIVNNSMVVEICQEKCRNDLRFYKKLLEEGVCREQARIFLPQNIFTEFVWKIDLRNLYHFIKLRIHSTAQKEIQVVAEKLYDFIKEKNPMAYEALQGSQKDITIEELKYILKHDIDSIPSASRRKEIEQILSV
jgi:thymidylate synthase (FAD)